MPKYYVSDGVDRIIIVAANPLQACVDSVLNGRVKTIMVDGYYSVNETGFKEEGDFKLNGAVFNPGDYLVYSDLVNEACIIQMNNN